MSDSSEPSTPPDTLPEHRPTFRWTQSPNPKWNIGDGLGDSPLARKWLEDESEGWKDFHPEQKDQLHFYRLISSGIIPRPVGFISTVSDEGIDNLAPFSWFQVVSSDPPVIMFSAIEGSKGRGNKDTVLNIKSNKGFTVNMISEPWVEASNFASVDSPAGVSEWAGSGLRKEKSTSVKAPWVRESAFATECELYDIKEIFKSSGKIEATIIFGLVKLLHVRNAVLTPDNLVDPEAFKPIIRLGKRQYATIGDAFSLPRQRWTELKEEIENLK